MKEKPFEEQLLDLIKLKIVREINTTDILKVSYAEKFSVPDLFIEKAWKSLNWDKIISLAKEKMETRICNAIIGGMETEIKTDVKKLMSVDGVRQKLRMNVYPELMKALENKE